MLSANLPELEIKRMMFGLGHWEIIVLVLVIVVVFGASRLPQVGSSLGKGIKNFRKSLKDDSSDSLEEEKKEQIEDKKDD